MNTFRFSSRRATSSGSHFLCPRPVLPETRRTRARREDKATHVGGYVGLSATPLTFLEAYLGVHTTASSNSLRRPHLLQVLGDTNFGLKAFMPHDKDSIFSAGGAARGSCCSTGAGPVGIDNASFGLRGMATLDLNNRKNVE